MTNLINRSICCDLIMVVLDYKKLQNILLTQASQPQWLRHTIIAVLNISEEDEKQLSSWYYEVRATKPMPNLIMVKPKEENKKSMPAMQNVGLRVSNNPYVYFQSENDDLPLNIDRAIFKLYHDENLYACIGRSEVYLKDGTPLEDFPKLDNNNKFIFDCYEATRLFPSYIDPFSTVYKKSVFEKIPYFDPEKRFKEFSYYHLILKMLENYKIKVEFVPYTIKKARRSKEFAGKISVGMRARLIHDIRLWLPEFAESKYKDFQMEILSLLENNDIITFKEIDARIEDYLDRNKKD